VVEDDPGVADVVLSAMGQISATSLRVDNGADAVRFLVDDGRRARVVLLDIDLPALDGFGVLQALRDAGVLARTHVIVLSSRASGQDTARALGLGAADHLAKPFSARIVSRFVRQALNDRRREPGVRP
jgi:DNA-binding response OmpR family regulator